MVGVRGTRTKFCRAKQFMTPLSKKTRLDVRTRWDIKHYPTQHNTTHTPPFQSRTNVERILHFLLKKIEPSNQTAGIVRKELETSQTTKKVWAKKRQDEVLVQENTSVLLWQEEDGLAYFLKVEKGFVTSISNVKMGGGVTVVLWLKTMQAA